MRPGALESLITKLHATLRAIDEAAAPLDDPDYKGGKPRNEKAHALAGRLATHYYFMTGERPKRINDKEGTYGPFFDLISEVFQALDIRESATHYARAAIERFMEK